MRFFTTPEGGRDNYILLKNYNCKTFLKNGGENSAEKGQKRQIVFCKTEKKEHENENF